MAKQTADDRDRWFKFFPSDYLGDENLRLCSMAAQGLWWRICCLTHQNGGYLLFRGVAPDDQTLARMVASTPAEVRRCLAELRELGVAGQTEDGILYSRRLVRDARRRQVNRLNGKEGGSPLLKGKSVEHTDKPLVGRSDKQSDNRSDNRDANRPDRHTRSQSPETRNQKPDRSPATAFEQFWQAYPNKKGKGAAEKAFARVDVPLEQLLAAIAMQRRSRQWREKDGQFIPHPATWLRQRRWEDEPADAGDLPAATGSHTVWDDVLERLRLRLSNYHFVTWFGASQLVDDDGNTLTIGVPDQHAIDWIQKHHRTDVTEALVECGLADWTVMFVVAPQKKGVLL